MAKKTASFEVVEHLFLCDGAKVPQRNKKQKVHRLKTGKKRVKDEIHLEIGALKERLTDNLPAVMEDLLEIATFVYAAGQLTSRGGNTELDYGYKWHREFDLAIPVREYGVWTDPPTKELLENLLSFVAGEHYTFHFSRKQKENPEFLGLPDSHEDTHHIKEVVLFSGGMDSFAGAVDEIAGQKKKIALVSHCSESKITHVQNNVYAYLTDHCQGPTPLHVPVRIYKGGDYITRDTNQRSRSFLFAALGAIVAKTLGLSRALFYENGIINCNLPFDSQTPQARRTRSTHPKFLSEMSELIELITKETFHFENPYLPMTRTDIVNRIVKLQQPKGIRQTRSCAKSRYEGEIRHDGVCSQCVDRRFATIAASCLEYDLQDDYNINIFLDELHETHDRTMVLGYVHLADKILTLSKDAFVEAFPDIHEIATPMRMPNSEAITLIYNLYRKHAKQVKDVIMHQMKENAETLYRGEPKHCLLNMFVMQKHKKYPALVKKMAEGTKKHGGGQLNEKVKHILETNPNISAPKIAKKIGDGTSAPTIRQTKAWKNRKK